RRPEQYVALRRHVLPGAALGWRHAGLRRLSGFGAKQVASSALALDTPDVRLWDLRWTAQLTPALPSWPQRLRRSPPNQSPPNCAPACMRSRSRSRERRARPGGWPKPDLTANVVPIGLPAVPRRKLIRRSAGLEHLPAADGVRRVPSDCA